ncbi:YrdB family protein [Deinococcus hopiensis]|uniref:DUF2568 domain-containing protein n=1 Tax=Deinococcus hopiensis KR-140 TaxID=695939 RepID=A0A1W1UD13_9DEIO|nr:YrdB family protein [Deinococcus hopiensis]SMB78940.1 Protein of unknown function [Deinococcus hopiensis KR-140]
MEMLKFCNLALAFSLELCVLIALGLWGFQVAHNPLLKVLLGLGVPLLTAVFWGAFLSPKASVSVAASLRVMLKLVVFGLAVLALLFVERPTLAWTFASLVLLNTVLAFIWKQ